MGGRRGGGGVFKWVERLGLASRSSSALAFNASLGSMSHTPPPFAFPFSSLIAFALIWIWQFFFGLFLLACANVIGEPT